MSDNEELNDMDTIAPTPAGNLPPQKEGKQQLMKIRIRIPERVKSAGAIDLPVSEPVDSFYEYTDAGIPRSPEPKDNHYRSARQVESLQNLRHRTLCSTASFHVSVECTSLTLSATGQRSCIIAGFADGTVRLFDLSEETTATATKTNRHDISLTKAKSIKSCVGGVIAARICAKGVNTALRLHVATTGSWAFAGAVRGSTELLAIRLDGHATGRHVTAFGQDPLAPKDDLAVFHHSDAKLRGFGACHKLEHSDTYLLLTGKAIKNIHIWSFQPPHATQTEPLWQCLYDCPTNGNTIKWLHFRRSYNGADSSKTMLQAISKSDGQKLRVWDLSIEDTIVRATSKEYNSDHYRPSRPPFYDVPNTESALGVAGNLVICGGTVWFNQMSIVSLDTLASTHHSSSTLYNHTELALPGVVPSDLQPRRQRTQRGDVQCVVDAAGTEGYVLVQLSSGTVAAYQPTQSSHGVVLPVSHIDTLPLGHVRQFHVDRVQVEQTSRTVAAMAVYNPFTGRGRVILQTLHDGTNVKDSSKSPQPMLRHPSRVNETPRLSTDPIRAEESQTRTSAVVTTAKKRPQTSMSKPTFSEASTGIVSTIKKKTGVLVETPSVIRGGSNMIHPTPDAIAMSSQRTAIPTVSSAQFLRRLSSSETVIKKTSTKGLTLIPTRGCDVIARVLKSSLPAATSPLPKPLQVREDSNVTAVVKAKQSSKALRRHDECSPEQAACPRYDDEKAAKPKLTTDLKSIQSTKRPPSRSLMADSFVPDFELPAIPRKRPAVEQQVDSDVRRKRTCQSKEPELRRTFTLTSKDREGSNRAITPWAAERFLELDTPPPPIVPSRTTIPAAISTKGGVNEISERIRIACTTKLRELQTLEDTVPRLGFWERRAEQSKLVANCMDHHELDRIRLVTQHRAVHEVLRRRVIETARNAIWFIYNSPVLSSLEKAKRFLTSVLQAFTEEIAYILQHQKLEADTLQALHHRGLKDSGAPLSDDVVFSFPLIFEDVLRCLPEDQ